MITSIKLLLGAYDRGVIVQQRYAIKPVLKDIHGIRWWAEVVDPDYRHEGRYVYLEDIITSTLRAIT